MTSTRVLDPLLVFQTLLYGRLGSIWSVPADGSGTPAIYVKDGLSPAVVR